MQSASTSHLWPAEKCSRMQVPPLHFSGLTQSPFDLHWPPSITLCPAQPANVNSEPNNSRFSVFIIGILPFATAVDENGLMQYAFGIREVIKLKIISALALLLAVSPVHAKKTVELCADDSCATKITREKLDCAIHKNKKKALSFGFKLSVAFAAKAGPEVTFGRSAEINWNAMSQELIRRYEELCDMHNKGFFSVAKFNERYEKLESYFDKAKDLKVEIEDTVQARAEQAFSDLDKEAEAHSGSTVEKAKEKVSHISNQVESLAKELKDFDSSGKDAATDKAAQKEAGSPP